MNIDKYANFSDWFNTIITEAQLCDLRYNVKGFVVFRPWAVKSMKLMYAAYEKELEARGHQPALFPALIPQSNFKIEGEHVEGFTPQVFWVDMAGENKLEERLAMRPTSETAMYQMYALWIQGLSDLPLKIYQSCQVWRHETKATKPFFRSREFYWIEAHDCFATEEEARRQVDEDMEMCEEVVHRQFGIPFLFFQRPEWDKFPGAVHTYAADTLMPDGRVLQLPSTHLLGQNFSKAFGVYYQDEKGARTPVWQTCYGPCISRIYGAMFCVHGDERGIMMPFEFAPVQVAIIPIVGKGKDEKAVIKYCHEVEKSLSMGGLRTMLDERQATPGFKYNHWELYGVPIRIEIGQREADEKKVTLAIRDKGAKEKMQVALRDADKEIYAQAQALDERIGKRADEYFASRQFEAMGLAEVQKLVEKGGIVKLPFCTMEKEGKACADELKAKYALDMRGIKYPHEKKPDGKKCIVCGKEAKHFAYAARQY